MAGTPCLEDAETECPRKTRNSPRKPYYWGELCTARQLGCDPGSPGSIRQEMTWHDAAQGSMIQGEDINGKLLELKFCCKGIYLRYSFLNPFVLFVHGMERDALTSAPSSD